jgi:hypothetical protein
LNSQTYDATIEQVINGSYLDVSLYLEHTGTSAPVLGECSFYVSYNNSALSNAVLQSDGQWDGDHNTGYGDNLVSRNHSLGVASIEVSMSGSPTYVIPDSKTLLGTIRFDIDNTSLNSGIQWNADWTEVNDDGDVDIEGNGDFQNPGDFSLPVVMKNLTAVTSRTAGITICWRTESEVNTAGFHVWKSEGVDNNYKRITTSMIPGQGNSSTAHEYSYSDKEVQQGVLYWYKIEEIPMEGSSTFYGPIVVEGVNTRPTEFDMAQNYPNPFNPQTTIDYQLPDNTHVTIRVYNLVGQLVKILVNKDMTAGYFNVTWDGLDQEGSKVSSGIYLVRMQTDSYVKVKKMTIIR